MPDPPRVGLLTRYLFENPYPLGVVLLAVAGGLAWSVLRWGRRERLRAAGGLAVLGVAALVTGTLVVTSGERARAVVGALVDAAVAGDVPVAFGHFAGDATLSFGLATNPGYPADEIHLRLQRLEDRYRIASNRITRLASYSRSSREATVHLACRTTLIGGYGPTLTQWVLEVERQPDGSWKVARVTWVSLNGRSPSPQRDF
ncbi:MAG: hypothetical protein ACYS0G_13960 [Planctomycetota bacterium]|jgi:hypothetical protein